MIKKTTVRTWLFSLIFERMYNHLVHFSDSNISSYQHQLRFRHRYSIQHAIIIVVKKITYSLFLVIEMFWTVDHRIIKKYIYLMYDIRDNIINWFEN